MSAKTETITIYSMGALYSENLTNDVQRIVGGTGIRNGLATVAAKHTTSAVMIVEHEAGIMVDIEDALCRLVPADVEPHHHLRGVDTNGRAHVFSALTGQSITVPVVDGAVSVDGFQDIVFLDFQDLRKERYVNVCVTGDVS